MSPLIKAGGDLSPPVRAIGDRLARPTGEASAQHRRIEQLEALLRERDGQLEEMRQSLASQRQEAFDEGFAAGLATADERTQDRLALLGKGIVDAKADLDVAIAGTERLAALLARECLDKMFDEVEDHAHLVCGLIGKQVALMESAALLAVHVSSSDFSSAALSELQCKFDLEGVEFHSSKDLPSGACRFHLRLGAMELGVDQQWPALQQLLTDLAREHQPA
ncbi:MAG TPA: hypothetical protein VKQ27_09155 [Acetobacteraceae bacterium]|nr:hypothetical protein [Acetobacteraceae bacterium]